MGDLPELLSILDDDHSLGRVVRATLRHRAIALPLETAPSGHAEQVLRVRLRDGSRELVVLAEVRGEKDGLYRLVLKPRTRVQAAELYALSEEFPEEAPTGPADEGSSVHPAPIASASEAPPEPTLSGDTVVDSVCVAERVMLGPTSGAPPRSVSGPAPGPPSFVPASRPVSHIKTVLRPSSPTSDDPLIGRVIAGKYKLVSLIGQGGAGAVYRGEHQALGRDIAVKILHAQNRGHDQFVKRFKAEARVVSLLDHPNVTRVMDFGQEPDGLLYLVMEYVAGQSLDGVIVAEGRVAQPRAVDIAIQTCGALARAHDNGVIHRDIKPENILLVPHVDDDANHVDLVKVCDFGMAKLKGPASAGEELTVGGMICGSPAYMPPEQTRGDDLDPRADIYSLGVSLYEAVTGELPFMAHTVVELLLKHAQEAPRRPSLLLPDVDPLLEDVILRALAKNRDDRHASVKEMRLELREVAEQLADLAEEATVISQRSPRL